MTGAAMAGMLALAGCAEPAGPEFADLRREATASDTLPISLPDYAFENVAALVSPLAE
ncbi:hypothetical protein M4I32_01275 [Microbacterium sp. LRZ72]|nr:hypothetical protein [Microbacterium sp. LRZ72]